MLEEHASNKVFLMYFMDIVFVSCILCTYRVSAVEHCYFNAKLRYLLIEQVLVGGGWTAVRCHCPAMNFMLG